MVKTNKTTVSKKRGWTRKVSTEQESMERRARTRCLLENVLSKERARIVEQALYDKNQGKSKKTYNQQVVQILYNLRRNKALCSMDDIASIAKMTPDQLATGEVRAQRAQIHSDKFQEAIATKPWTARHPECG